MVVEHLLIYTKNKKLSYFSFSSLSTAMGVILMMTTMHLWIILFVVGLGLVQKHFLVIGKQHFFNPSNFALMAGLFLFYNDAHLVLGQLGDSLWLKVLVSILALTMLVRVNRWMIVLVFTLFYLLLQYIFVVNYDPVLILENVYHRFYSVSFILFILFMLTDPRTTPKYLWQQALFAFFIAGITVLLDRYIGFRVQHMFMALFIMSLFVPCFNLCRQQENRKKLGKITFILFVLVLGVIIYIQNQIPYYFEMNG